MGIEESSFLWNEMDMGAVLADFQKLFPQYTFDGKAVMGLLLQGKVWTAVKELTGGITGAFLVTKSGDKIAKHFGISKYTLYSYIDMKQEENKP